MSEPIVKLEIVKETTGSRAGDKIVSEVAQMVVLRLEPIIKKIILEEMKKRIEFSEM